MLFFTKVSRRKSGIFKHFLTPQQGPRKGANLPLAFQPGEQPRHKKKRPTA
jgi:hypothetical protein